MIFIYIAVFFVCYLIAKDADAKFQRTRRQWLESFVQKPDTDGRS